MQQPTALIEAMSFTQIIDRTIRVYGKSFVRLMIIGLIASIPTIFFMNPASLLEMIPTTGTPTAADTAASIGPSAIGGQLLLFVLVVLAVLGFQMTAIVVVVSAKFLGKEEPLHKQFVSVLPRIPKLLLAVFVYAIGLGIVMFIWFFIATLISSLFFAGATAAAGELSGPAGIVGILGGSILGGIAYVIVLMLPIIYLGLPMVLFPATAAIEKRSIFGIMDRSWALMKGMRLKSFFSLFTFSIIYYALYFGALALVGMDFGPAGAMETSYAVLTMIFLINLLLGPFYYVAAVLLYYDSRIRKEAFGLELLAQDLGIGDGGAPLEG